MPLEYGRLPIHNNWSENELRREALGRKNWLFVGNDEVNATLVTLLASCRTHDLEPLGYLRDLFCLYPVGAAVSASRAIYPPNPWPTTPVILAPWRERAELLLRVGPRGGARAPASVPGAVAPTAVQSRP